MNAQIHPTAIVDSEAQLGVGVIVGPYAIIGSNVQIGAQTTIGPHVQLDGRTTIGERCVIAHSAVIGTAPQDLKYRGEDTAVIIGNNTTVREFATINRSTNENHPTSIGDHCLLMAYTHVGHDCTIGNHVILANCVNLAGHVQIEDYASVGGMTPVHQFVHIGCHAFIGGFSRINQDVAPYMRGAGIPFKTVGLNSVGLMRRGVPSEIRLTLKRLYRLFYRSHLNATQAITKIKEIHEKSDEIQHFIDFFERSERGIHR